MLVNRIQSKWKSHLCWELNDNITSDTERTDHNTGGKEVEGEGVTVSSLGAAFGGEVGKIRKPRIIIPCC